MHRKPKALPVLKVPALAVHAVIDLVVTFPSRFFFFFFNEFLYLFIYLAAPGLSCGTRDLFSCGMHAKSGSLTRDRTRAPCIGSAES